jgi:hypothetical protein
LRHRGAAHSGAGGDIRKAYQWIGFNPIHSGSCGGNAPYRRDNGCIDRSSFSVEVQDDVPFLKGQSRVVGTGVEKPVGNISSFRIAGGNNAEFKRLHCLSAVNTQESLIRLITTRKICIALDMVSTANWG